MSSFIPAILTLPPVYPVQPERIDGMMVNVILLDVEEPPKKQERKRGYYPIGKRELQGLGITH